MPRRGENIRKRKDGRWEARYVKGRDIDGKIHYGYLYGKSYAEVKDKKSKIISENPNAYLYTSRSSLPPQDDRIHTVSIQWKAQIRYTVKESTYSNYEEILDNHILPLLGEMQVKKFTNHTIAGFIQKKLEQGMAYGSIHVIISVLKNILRYAQDFGYFPAEPLKFPRIPSSSSDIQIMSSEDYKKLDACLLSNMDSFSFGILLCMYTGIRVGDDDDKIRLNQRKPSKYKGLSRFGPEKNLQRINKFMKERPTFYKKLIQMKENFRFYLRCFYCITKVVILQFNSEKQDRISS